MCSPVHENSFLRLGYLDCQGKSEFIEMPKLHSQDIDNFDDIVKGVIRVLDKPASPNADFDPNVQHPATSSAPYRVFNIGNGSPVPLMNFIGALDKALGIEAIKEFLPMQPCDVLVTSADTRELEAWVGFQPSTSVTDGVVNFVKWYRGFYNV